VARALFNVRLATGSRRVSGHEHVDRGARFDWRPALALSSCSPAGRVHRGRRGRDVADLGRRAPLVAASFLVFELQTARGRPPWANLLATERLGALRPG
jgi:hypothetical protein